jgi:hypothetical protein
MTFRASLRALASRAIAVALNPLSWVVGLGACGAASIVAGVAVIAGTGCALLAAGVFLLAGAAFISRGMTHA